MTPVRSFRIILVVAAISTAGAAIGAAAAPEIYVLDPNSTFEWGCFDPCACPIYEQTGLQGTFKLTHTGSDPLFDYYDVSEVTWSVPNSWTPASITGFGTYRRGGEVAIQEELALDLSFNGGQRQRFDSGLVPARAIFPRIDIQIQHDRRPCIDSVLHVIAQPFGTASTDAQPAVHVSVRPNPFHAATDVEFTMSRAGRASLRIFDLAGREVRALARDEWFEAGVQRRTWDGTLERGGAAPAGLYLLRLDRESGPVTRPIVKLR